MIDRLRELLRADGVTAGPWWSDSPGFGTIFVDAPTHDERVWLFDVREGTDADAALIVEAVNALPELLDAHDRMAGALEQARLVAQWHDAIGSGPIEVLSAELGELAELCRTALAVPKEENPDG